MSNGYNYGKLQPILAEKICNLFYDLGPSTYDETAPKIEYWIEYVLTEDFIATDDLLGRVSPMAWSTRGSHSDISRFLKEFRDAPHRSDQVRSFVDKLCRLVLRWFAIASAEHLRMDDHYSNVATLGGNTFIRAASFVGHLIECGLLDHDLVRRHLVKPLISHHYINDNDSGKVVRANAIYQLFIVAGNTLLRSVLEPGDVQVCFETLDSQITLGEIAGLDAARLNELREIHTARLQNNGEEEERSVTTAEALTGEANTPLAFVQENLPSATTDTNVPSSMSRGIAPPSMFQDVEYPADTFFDIPATAVSSPTFSISTLSDLTPTELGDETEDSGEWMITRHETFYFEDGNVEFVCGHTLFRVHSTTISFSSQKLRDILSQPALLHVPVPEGCPRITVTDTAQDFAVLLKMIYTPGFPAWRKVPEFTVFVSLLRMITKYGFSDVRDQLVDSIKGAYPTKWEGPGIPKVLGEDIFGSPKPHPNAVLILFTEQNIKFALPFAAYRAALGGFSSLTSDQLGTILPRPALASTIYGMEVIRGRLAHLAHSVVCTMSLEVCRGKACAVNVDTSPPERRMEALNFIMVKGGKGDVLFSPSLRRVVCVSCVKKPEEAYRLWCTMIWEDLPRIFGVGKSWEEVF